MSNTITMHHNNVKIDNHKPRYWQAAEHRAKLLGKTVCEVLEDDIQSALNSNYPTPDCLDVSDIEMYSVGTELEPQHKQHVASCDFCQSLLDSHSPDNNVYILNKFRVEVLKVATEELREMRNTSSTNNTLGLVSEKLLFGV